MVKIEVHYRRCQSTAWTVTDCNADAHAKSVHVTIVSLLGKSHAAIVGLLDKSLPKPEFDTKDQVLYWDFLAGNLCIVFDAWGQGPKILSHELLKRRSTQKWKFLVSV